MPETNDPNGRYEPANIWKVTIIYLFFIAGGWLIILVLPNLMPDTYRTWAWDRFVLIMPIASTILVLDVVERLVRRR